MSKETQNTTLVATMCIYILASSGIIPPDLVTRLMQAVAAANGMAMPFPLQDERHSEAPSDTQYAVGIRGLSQYIHTSPPSVQKLVNDGKLASAISRVGRKYLFDKKKVDELLAAGALGL